MNILKTSIIYPSYYAERVKPDFDFTDNELISYVYCKACQQINLGGLEYEEDLLKIIFNEEELKRLSSLYIEVAKDKEPLKYEQFTKKDESYDFSEILSSFSNSLKSNPDIYFGLLYYACQNKLDNIFCKSNPLSKIIHSHFMKNISNTFNLFDYEIIFLCLNLINYKTHLLFNDKMSDSAKIKLFLQFYKEDISLDQMLFIKMNKRFKKLGFFSNDWEINDFVYSYFCGNTYPFNIEQIHPKEFGDCYSMNSLISENIDDIFITNKIMQKCYMKKKGCYITLSNINEYRAKNFLSLYNISNDYNTYEISYDNSNFDKNAFIFFLIAASSQLPAKSSAILLDSVLLKNFLTEPVQNNNTIKIYANQSQYDDNQNKTQKINFSLFENIAIPVYMLTNDLNENEQLLLHNNLRIIYNWNLKNPSHNEYQEQFTQYLKENRINPELIQTVASECNRLKIKPKKWSEVVDIISVIDSPTTSDIKHIIEANFDISKENHNSRNNSHYSLEALKTTEPVENIVKALQNAEKWQLSEYDSDSGIRILNYGISGTGKTAFVENIAKMLDRPLKIVRASDILGMYVGETEKNIKNTFEEAAKTNSILLIDEADSFLHGRGDSFNRHNDSKVNEFLVQMERFPGILFCNTNLPDNLDSATDRRFHKKIGFNPLDKNGITLLLKSYFDKFTFSEKQTNQIYNSGDVTPGDFGSLFGQLRFFAPEELTSDYICEELKNLVKNKKRSWEKTRNIGFTG